jgi:hypothetical protein
MLQENFSITAVYLVSVDVEKIFLAIAYGPLRPQLLADFATVDLGRESSGRTSIL